MGGRVVKRGSGLDLGISGSIVTDCGVLEDSRADTSFRKDEVVMEPMRERYVLGELLAGISLENVHGEAGMDEPVGQEIL
ncbi:antitoxin MazE [Desulfomicrobium norvegicum]|uniref:Antitoxin MazE n=1 Tax=Desulfomicrobium norvegicum (strain DSM 1741 / NCIMB 8310) TaxID=52561 RepID=A0A8G2F7H3_DESNO|nr:AbrB/MazE/SpoVT family DNA-binding domain-containing protein [Desulfomicrobium norvegicum]SFM21659.1 antitoxin MazE [Desulfomicrobium norvegicum]